MSAHRVPRRARRITLAVILMAAVAAGTFVIARWTAPLRTDPQARDKPAPTVTVTAVQRQLTLTLDLSATVHPADALDIPVLTPAGTVRTVVTATPTPLKAAVTSGTVLVEISGRPVIALPGSRPAYRNLSTGDSGPDVRQLQQALRALGYAPDTDGTFATNTGRAVTAFYQDRGYLPIRSNADTVSVPAGELAFVPRLPVTLAALPAGLGADPTGKAITVQSSAPGVLIAALSATASAAAPADTPVVLQCAGTEVRGHLGGAADQPDPAPTDNNTPGTSQVARSVTVSPATPNVPIGTTCAGTATVAVTAGPVLAVPASAVYDSTDHGTVVLVTDGEHTTTVPVSLGQSADGWLEITNPPATVHPGVALVAGAGGS